MGNPYAPPSESERGPGPGESLRPTRHWFWKVYAVVFAAAMLLDTVAFVSGRMPVQAVVHQTVRVLSSLGVVKYAFSKGIGRPWLWRLLCWVFPLSELIVYLTETAAAERALAAHPGVRTATLLHLAALFVPLASLALYRLSRMRILT